MSFVGPALNFACVIFVGLSVAIFWSNKQLKSEISQLASDAEALKIRLENIHQTCKNSVVGAFPRIPATHIVTHSDEEQLGLNIETNVTFITLYIADRNNAWSCLQNQIETITSAFPRVNVFNAVVSGSRINIKTVAGVKAVGIFRDKATALNMAVKQLSTPYFLILDPDFVIEPRGLDSGIEWLHHALVVTPGIDIVGGSLLSSNNELVVPCYSLNFCNWTLTRKYEYERSFGEIMICHEVSYSFMARKDIFEKFSGELFDKNLDGEHMFIDFFLHAKKLELTVANRPEVLFVQEGSCVQKELSNAEKMDAIMPFAKKHQILQVKEPDNSIHSICDGSSSICTTEKMVKDFNFPSWYDEGMFAYPFVVQQAIRTLEIAAEKLQKAGITFALRRETLFGAVMTKSMLPWGRLQAVQLSVFGTKTQVTKFAASNGYHHTTKGDTIEVTADIPSFSVPMKVQIVVKPSSSEKIVNVRVNGKLYPVLADPISELKREYGENYLADWFYHIPAARSKNEQRIVVPIHSQIPGLSNIPEESITDENDRRFKRKWIRDTDSKYVKLAKAGGRKNLLSFLPGKLSSEPVLYPRVEWFDHHEQSDQVEEENKKTNDKQKSSTDNVRYTVLPEWYVHDEPDKTTAEVAMEIGENELSNGQGTKKKPMLGHDCLTVWERETQEAAEKRSKALKLPKIRKKNASKKKDKAVTQETIKFSPKLKFSVTNFDETQDMKRLLSMDYQRVWLSNKSAEYTKEMKAQLILEKEKEARQRRIARRLRESLKPKKEVVSEKPLFKLSRFNKVKSCVDTRWSKLEIEDKSLAH